MKKKIALTTYGSIIFFFAFSLAAGPFPVQTLNADTGMDSKIILAMEKVKEEMRENGELGEPTVEETEDGLTDLPLAEPAAVHPEIEIRLEEIVTDRPAEPVKAEPAASPSPEPAEISLKEQLEKRGSLKFVDEDIRVVLRSLAKAYGFNVTLAPEVQGKVTVDFNNVKIINALDTILVDQGLGYRISGSILRVTTLEKIQEENAADASREAAAAQKAIEEAKKRVAQEAAEPLVVKIFKLKYIDANDAKEAIEPMISPNRGKVMVLQTKQYTGFEFEATETFGVEEAEKAATEFVRSRTLIVQDIQTVLDRVEEVIVKIDMRPPQIIIDAKILEVPVDREFRLGINWTQALNQWKVGVKDMEAILGRSYKQEDDFKDSSKHDWGSEYELKSTWTEGEDRKSYDRGEGKAGDTSGRMSYAGSGWPASGGGEIKIPDLLTYNIPSAGGGPFQQNVAWRAAVENDIRTTGWADEFYTRIEDSDTKSNFDNYLYGISDTLSKLTTSSQSYNAVLSAIDFSLMLSAMKTDSNIVILSNPRIIVHENYAAKIFVGERYPILSTEVGTGGGGAVGGTSVDEWKEIGITLKVIPQVRDKEGGEGKSINMIIHPAVSKTEGFAYSVDNQGNQVYSSYPIIKIREADTNVTINDGDTIVIGGLISSYTVDEEEKIPLLGDIPILGYLFKEEHTKLEKTNLLIFITASIVGEDIELSPYEKIMLEKSPADALEDIRYVEDDQLRPYLYKSAKEPEPPEPEEGEREEGKDSEREDNKGNFGGRIMTKAMKRSRWR